MPYVTQPNHIVAVIEKRYKIAKYYNPVAAYATGAAAGVAWEMYDTASDPDETVNLASKATRTTPKQKKELARLKARLEKVERAPSIFEFEFKSPNPMTHPLPVSD